MSNNVNLKSCIKTCAIQNILHSWNLCLQSVIYDFLCANNNVNSEAVKPVPCMGLSRELIGIIECEGYCTESI